MKNLIKNLCTVIAALQGLDKPWFEFQKGQEILLFSNASSLALRPNQLPIRWYHGFLPLGSATGVMKWTTHFHHVPRLRMA